MKVIAKVIRCHVHQYRLSLFLPEGINTSNVKSLRIEFPERTVKVKNVDWYRRYKSICDSYVGVWVDAEGLGHNAGDNLHLLKFELTVETVKEGESHILKYEGSSVYTKYPHKNYCLNSIDGKKILAIDDAINIL